MQRVTIRTAQSSHDALTCSTDKSSFDPAKDSSTERETRGCIWPLPAHTRLPAWWGFFTLWWKRKRWGMCMQWRCCEIILCIQIRTRTVSQQKMWSSLLLVRFTVIEILRSTRKIEGESSLPRSHTDRWRTWQVPDARNPVQTAMCQTSKTGGALPLML